MEMKQWVRVKYKTISRAIEALLMAGDYEHQKARETQGVESKNHRAEAEEFHAAKSDLWNASHQEAMKNCSDESIHGNSAPIQQTKVVLGERGAMILAISLSVGLAGWAAARVEGLKDHMDESQRISQNEIEHYKESFAKVERQSRMTELKLDDYTVVMHRAGLALPGDYTRGPQGNLDAESFHLQEKDHGSRRNHPSESSGVGHSGQ